MVNPGYDDEYKNLSGCSKDHQMIMFLQVSIIKFLSFVVALYLIYIPFVYHINLDWVD